MKPEILFLKQEDVIKAGLLDMKMVLAETEKTFKMIGQNQIINPTKVFLGMPSDENWDSYCMSMPAYIGGDVDTAGFKWAAESKANSQLEGVPYGIDIVVLSDPKTVFPKAILDGLPGRRRRHRPHYDYGYERSCAHSGGNPYDGPGNRKSRGSGQGV